MLSNLAKHSLTTSSSGSCKPLLWIYQLKEDFKMTIKQLLPSKIGQGIPTAKEQPAQPRTYVFDSTIALS